MCYKGPIPFSGMYPLFLAVFMEEIAISLLCILDPFIKNQLASKEA